MDPEKGRYSGHRAVGKALLACGGLWLVVGRLILVPPLSWLAIPGYALVACFRGYLPGTTLACKRPVWLLLEERWRGAEP